MRPGYSIFILSLIMLAVVIAGCSGSSQQSTPTPSPTPNVTATPTAAPDIKGTIHSSQVRMADFEIIQGAGRTGNYTITLQNLGSMEARNVSVSIYAKDIKTLAAQQDTIYELDRPIPANRNTTIAIPTGMYDFETTSVILNIRIYWGDNSEFWNGENMTHILPWAPQPVEI
jgi:hypothetical protein